MKLDFKLDFLYHQKEYILDGEDEKTLESRPDALKFNNYIKNASVEDLIQLLVFAYSKEYANEIYWSTQFIGEAKGDTNYPEGLDPSRDIYLVEHEISKDGYNKVVFKLHEDKANNCFYTEWMEFEFSDSQNLNTLINAVQVGFKEVDYVKEEENVLVNFIPRSGAISKLTISTTSLRIDLNSDKWKVYAGF